MPRLARLYSGFMSADENTPNDDNGSSAEAVVVSVEKSSVEALLSWQHEVGIDGEYLWPIPPLMLLNLYKASAEHCRAIHLKAEGAFGGGLIGNSDPLEELCETGAAELFTLLDLDLGTYGNAFLQKIYARESGRLVAIRRLPAITMSVHRSGFLQRIGRPGSEPRKVMFRADEIVHLKELCPSGRTYALPSWIGVEGMLELAWAATKYNATFFANHALPEYAVIFYGATPSKDQKRTVAEFFRSEHRGLENAHRTLLLTLGNEDAKVEFKRLTSEVKDGDFLKLLDAARDRVPVAHGTPPRVMGIMSAGQLGGGGEAASQLFIFEHTTLKPRRRRTLDQLRPLLRELGLRPGKPESPLADDEVAFQPLDLTPPKDDAEDLPGLVTSGILTAAEARALMPAIANVPTGDPITRAAPDDMAALVALLARS